MRAKLLTVLVVGYGTLTRTFAYLGIPSLNLFVGEATLAAFLLWRPRQGVATWLAALVRPSQLTGIAWTFLALFCYGILEVLRGVLLDHPVFTALRDFAFNYYPLFLFLGLSVGQRDSAALRRVLRILAWCNGLYGVVYVLGLGHSELTLPWGPDIPLFGQPGASAIALLGIFSSGSRLRETWLLLLLNSISFLGLQVRAEWLGLVVGAAVWMLMTGKVRPVAASALTVLVLLGVAYATDLRIPVAGRGTLSAGDVISRALAPVDPELAGQFSESSAAYRGTIVWRQRWWSAIWSTVNSDATLSVVGYGYGFELHELEPNIPSDVRTPHNAFYYALGYTGWCGVMFLALFHTALGAALWKTFRSSGESFGFSYWCQMVAMSFFGSTLETPFNAIPFYLLVGLALGSGLRTRVRRERASVRLPREHPPGGKALGRGAWVGAHP